DEDKPAATRIEDSRKGKGKKKTKARAAAASGRTDEPREPLPVGKIAMVLGAIVFVLGIGGGVAFYLYRTHKIEDNLSKADQFYEKKEWKSAREHYQKVLDISADNERAQARRKDCDDKLDALFLDDEAQKRIKKSREMVDPNGAINALSEDSKEQPLNEDQRKKL